MLIGGNHSVVDRNSYSYRRLWGLFLALLLLVPQFASADQTRASRPVLQNLPLSFERNQGQTDAQVKFLARGNGYAVFLTPNETVLGLTRPDTKATSVLRMRLLGAKQDPQISGRDALAGTVNYLVGNDPAQWRSGIPTFAKVEYGAVYPGVDLVFYGNGRTLEYDFVVAPGADPEQIGFAIDGAEKVSVDAGGDLVLQMAGGELRMHKPVVYQDVDGVRTPIDGRFVLKGANQVGFQVAAYDAGRALVIDPVLVYSTFLGGGGADMGLAIAADGGGNVYATGSTQSSNFPLTAALSTALSGNTDAFVTKFTSSGGVLFSTYLGGGSPDEGRGIAVDQSGNIYLTGYTQSSNFPTTAGAYDGSNSGSVEAFVTRLNNAGTAITYSTFLGGKNVDVGNAIAASGGKVYVTGTTTSGGRQNPFPTTDGTSYGGKKDTDAFVAIINPVSSGTADLVFSTILGDSGGDDSGNGIAVGNGNVYVTGASGSQAFVAQGPSAGGALSKTNLFAGVGYGIAVGGSGVFATGSKGADAFITKLGASGWTKTISGAVGRGIAVDVVDHVFATGSAASGITPTDAPFGGGSSDAFVAKFSTFDGTRTYFTYLGGSGTDVGNGIAVKANGDVAYIVGTTSSITKFPTTAAFDATCGDPGSPCSDSQPDAFVTALKFDTTPPDVTINQAATQLDPTKISPINFTVVFSEQVIGFDASDVSIDGTAGGVKSVVVSGAGPTYNVAVSGMTTAGTVIASIGAGKVTDLAGNLSTGSTSTDNEVTWSNMAPVITLTSPNSPTTAMPTFAGVAGTVPGDNATVTVKVYAGSSASGTPEQTLTTTRDGTTGAYSVNAASPLPDGQHTARAQQSDVLGNTGYSDPRTFLVDSKRPTFGPVSNLMFQTGTGFSLPIPVAFDADPTNPAVTCTVPGGQEVAGNYTAGNAPFPLGDTTVTCTATDTAGNIGTIQFIVTVTTTAPPTLGVNVYNLSVPQGAPIPLTATINVPQSTLTIAPDCVNTTWTIKKSDGSVVPPRHREKVYGIPNDLVTLDPSLPWVVGCDASDAVDPVLLPPGHYKFFATYSNYITDQDPDPPVYDVWTGSVNSPEADLEITTAAAVMRVNVDVKPTTTVNSWNCDSPGQGTTIAVLSGEIYDPNASAPTYRRMFFPATEVNASAVKFGKIGTEVTGTSPSTADVNGDGVPDLILHFPIQGSGFDCTDIPAGEQDTTVVGVVTGTTMGGVGFAGSDRIRLVTGTGN